MTTKETITLYLKPCRASGITCSLVWKAHAALSGKCMPGSRNPQSMSEDYDGKEYFRFEEALYAKKPNESLEV